MNYLSQTDQYPELSSDFVRYQVALVQGQLKSVEEEITQLRNLHPQLLSLSREQLQDKLINIEADTYAELIRAGRLDANPYERKLSLLGKKT